MEYSTYSRGHAQCRTTQDFQITSQKEVWKQKVLLKEPLEKSDISA